MRASQSADGPARAQGLPPAARARLRRRRRSSSTSSACSSLHRKDRVLVFTQDNATAYAVARRFLVPGHHAPDEGARSAARSSQRFADGRYGAVVTSKVLNEGVDVPDANVAIVLSGSGSVREHVQRLGRVLRREGRQAGRPLRARVRRDGRGVHERAPPRALAYQ